MKKILLASALFLAVQGVQAQEGTATERATAKTEQLNQAASLTDEQKEKVQTVFEGIEMKNEGVRNDASMSEAQKAEIIESNKSAEANMMQGILTDEQYNKYKTMLQPKKTVGSKSTPTGMKKATN